MRNRIFEIRREKPFTREEIEHGTIDTENHKFFSGDILDVVPADMRKGHIKDLAFRTNVKNVFHLVDDNTLSLDQKAYDRFIEEWVDDIKKKASVLTPIEFSSLLKCSVARALSREEYGCIYVFYHDDDEWDFYPVDEFIRMCSYLDDNGDGRKFYIGAIHNYTC